LPPAETCLRPVGWKPADAPRWQGFITGGPRRPRVPRPARILWAEDDPQDQELIRASLQELPRPPRVDFAVDGVSLLEGLARDPPALVVLDLKMPRMGGLDTLRLLRGEPSTRAVPVVVFSSGSLPQEVAQVESLGVLRVVQKPIGFDAFAAAVKDIVRAYPLA
jgi:CheY-like chemotaxis protein